MYFRNYIRTEKRLGVANDIRVAMRCDDNAIEKNAYISVWGGRICKDLRKYTGRRTPAFSENTANLQFNSIYVDQIFSAYIEEIGANALKEAEECKNFDRPNPYYLPELLLKWAKFFPLLPHMMLEHQHQ